METSDGYLGVAAYARKARCRLDTVYAKLRAGRIRGARKLDGRWLIPKQELEALLEQRRALRRRRRGPSATPAIPSAAARVAAQPEAAIPT